MSFEYWYMFPVAIVIAILANASGFSGGVLFQPFYNIFMNIPMQNAVATGIATETIGMTSGSIRYFMMKTSDLSVGFTMIMLTIPGVVVGNHALLIMNENFLKLMLGIVIFVLASMQLFSAVKNRFGTKMKVQIEDVYPHMWAPPIGGFFSATTGTGMAEIAQPVLEKGMGMQTKRANATAILIESVGNWVITILNLHAGMILWEIWIFSGSGVIIGGQIGPMLTKYVSDRVVKLIFSICVIFIAVFYIYQGSTWVLKTYIF